MNPDMHPEHDDNAYPLVNRAASGCGVMGADPSSHVADSTSIEEFMKHNYPALTDDRTQKLAGLRDSLQA